MKKVSAFVKKLVNKDRLTLARGISIVESRGELLKPIMEAVFPHAGNAFVLGITGPPGAGKSTVTDKLVAALRKEKQRVAVVAIDPSSPFTGGAVLGDRIRMQDHFNDPGVYIRSLGTRGKHGGLSHSARDVVTLLDAAGFDWIIVETAGVGQTELDILKLAHGVIVVLVPESGDGIQIMKAGLMEIADIFVVNKSDRPEADKIARELVTMVSLANPHHNQKEVWSPPVLKTQALFAQGIADVLAEIKKYKKYLVQTGQLENKRKQFLKDEMLEILIEKTSQGAQKFLQTSKGLTLLDQVFKKKISPQKAAQGIKVSNVDQKSLK